MSLLVVEDDTRVADFLIRGLKAEGYGVDHVKNGRSGYELAMHGGYDLIILDLMLPEMHGLDVCQELRKAQVSTPIIMLTAMHTLDDRIEGLRLGADDYLPKPFSFDELLARIEAQLRRNRNFQPSQNILEVGDLSLNLDTLDVYRAEEMIDLTAKELAILELMMRSPGKVFSRERILSNVWGTNVDPLTNIVDVYIGKIRKKIDGNHDFSMLKTIRRRGYKIVQSDKRAQSA